MSLPDGSVLLHIGPQKTGTTTVQAAFHENRESLAAEGVHYAGRTVHSIIAAMSAAASGGGLATIDADAGATAWRAIVDEVRGSSARQIVLSSEFYSGASVESIRSILDALGADRVHVVVTLRPLVRIVASQWQQYMQNRAAIKYDDDLDYPGWLDEVLNRPEEGRHGTPSFWKRHRHDLLIERWASVVGPDRMTIVVVDDSDRQMVTRSFEDLVGVAPGTLAPPQAVANRSLTYPEIRLLMAFNRQFVARGLSVADYTRFVRFWAVRHLLERPPAADEPRLLTPQWAVDQVAAVGAESARAIEAMGIRVVGDLDLLGDPSVASRVGENVPSDAVPVEIAVRFVVGLIKVAAQIPGIEAPPQRRPGPLENGVRRDKLRRRAPRRRARLERELAQTKAAIDRIVLVDTLSRAQLARVISGRLRRRLGRLVRRLRSSSQ